MLKNDPGWLPIEELKPLDVILSRSTNKRSLKSARLTGGEFSHAALVLDTGIWFDAQPSGCGMYSAAAHAEECSDGRSYLNLNRYGHVRVLRHPILDALSAERQRQLASIADKRCQELIGCHYAPYDMLLPLIRAPFAHSLIKRWPSQMRRLARAADKFHAVFLAAPGTRGIKMWEAILCGHKTASSHFCSELVVSLYHAIGLDVAIKGESTSFGPSDLADPARSLLHQIEVVCQSKPESLFPEGDDLWNEDRAVMKESKKLLAESDAALRSGLSKERLDNYFTFARKDLDTESLRRLAAMKAGLRALGDEAMRLMELSKNLQDLALALSRGTKQKEMPECVRAWNRQILQDIELPLPPSVAAVVRIGLAQITEEEKASNASARKVIEYDGDLYGKIEKLRLVAKYFANQIAGPS